MECPHGICDGSGYITTGQFDDLKEEKCLCKIESEEIDMDDDSDEVEVDEEEIIKN